MSFEIIQEVQDRSHDITGPEMSVLLALAGHANDRRICWPGNDLLSDETRYGRSTVIRTLGQLEHLGYITYGMEGRVRKIRIAEAEDWAYATPRHYVKGPAMGPQGPAPGLQGPAVTPWGPAVTPEPVKNQSLTSQEPTSPSETEPGETMCTESGSKWNSLTLADHFLKKVVREMCEYGADPVGSVNQRAMASQIKKIRMEFDLSLEEVHTLMHTYAVNTSLWRPGKHPAWDFVTRSTIIGLRNIQTPKEVVLEDGWT